MKHRVSVVAISPHIHVLFTATRRCTFPPAYSGWEAGQASDVRQRQRQCCVTVSLDYLVLSNHDKAFQSLIWPQGATFHQHRLLCGESKRSDELQRLKIDKRVQWLNSVQMIIRFWKTRYKAETFSLRYPNKRVKKTNKDTNGTLLVLFSMAVL